MTAAGRASAVLVSGEGVELDVSRAGIASRTVATAIDVAVQLVALLLLTTISLAVAGDGDSAAERALVIVELVFVVAGYPIVLEWTTRGRTLGKLALGLRVVRDDGGPIGLRHALVRGLASLVLEKPGLLVPFGTIAGALCVTIGAREKRLGDLMAGTVVIDERAAPQALATPHPWVPPPLLGWARTVDLHGVDDRLALRIRQFVGRAYAMSPAAQEHLGRRLFDRVLAAVTPPPPPGAPIPDVLGTVLLERRRRAELSWSPAAESPPRHPGPQYPGPHYPPPAPPASAGPFAPPQ